jgi:Uma2 family endonuclease
MPEAEPHLQLEWRSLRQAEASAGRALSAREWLEFGEDEQGELVGGRLEEEEAPDAVHELAVAWLLRLIGTWLGPNGFVFGSELKFLISEGSGRKPDLSVFFPGSTPPARTGALRRPPDVAIEVVTPSPRDERRDRVEKMADYAGFGVRYYWLVDPALGTFEIFERTPDGHYVKLSGVTAGTIAPVPGCSGLVIDVDRLWAELRRLADE